METKTPIPPQEDDVIETTQIEPQQSAQETAQPQAEAEPAKAPSESGFKTVLKAVAKGLAKCGQFIGHVVIGALKFVRNVVVCIAIGIRYLYLMLYHAVSFVYAGIAKRLQVAKEKSLWLEAKLECIILRTTYRTVKFVTMVSVRLVRVFVSAKLLRTIGDFFYAMGFQTEYRLVLLGRICKGVTTFLAKTVFSQIFRALKFVWREIVIVWRELFRPFYYLARGIYRVFADCKNVTKEKNAFFGFVAAIVHLFKGLFHYVHLLPGMVSYVLPFIAVAFFVMVVQTTFAQEYTLEVKVDGVTIGYVENEMVFENAKDDVQERVDYASTDASTWDISPTYTLSTQAATLTEAEMADALLMASSEEISEATAVYIQGELRYITAQGDELQAYLDSLMAPYVDENDPNLEVGFNKEIELSEGIYFTETFTDVSVITEYLSGLEAAQINYTVVAGDSWSLIASKNGMTQAEIFAMNPGMSADSSIYPGDQLIIGLEQSVLEVLIYRTIEYDEAIAYTTTKSESSDYNFGTTQVTQTGVDGVRHITAAVTYDTSGNALSTEILTSEVTLQPIEQIEVVGTYLSSGMIAEVGTGTLMWPVPNYTYVSRWASSSHDGVDICGPAGTAIYAADSGVVIKAGYNAAGTGYGYSIVIDHGNGYQTLYAHGLSVAVSVGQVVSQGDYIMPMGSTGYSTGNHLHFEIEYYGSLIWPQNIF